MAKQLLSVGLDVGTTSTQMILSRLTAENKASGFAVPKMEITDREILYRSPVHFTPLAAHNLVDAAALRTLIQKEYENAEITREQVDTGAVIITGETSRKENAKAVLEQLSDLAGDFVVATAGPDLESILAARGAGAMARSEGRRVLHMDIGGGTSNLCLIEDGKVLATGCLNVGGRLLKLDKNGAITYRSPVLAGITDLREGMTPTPSQLETLANALTSALEMAAGLIPETDILCKLTTKETGKAWNIPRDVIPSFSGGVADCIAHDFPDNAFGDIGPILGRAIRESRLCAGEYFLGEETIRATVIGAGCHSVQLSGSTVFSQNIRFPMKNIPTAVGENPKTPQNVQAMLAGVDSDIAFLCIPGFASPTYGEIKRLAKVIAEGFGEKEILVCLQNDCAKALGHCLRLLLPNRPCLCLDGLSLESGSYLDVGEPVGPAFAVVIKTFVLSGGNR
ncbi:MAG: ethanolamine ammonia-lyase reactivating factor EutA [Oscillospiraceae bacterium]|nr:ethanolamine ammonia-lyase reactivating factor EutA [Oscillospiraceae bacterium]